MSDKPTPGSVSGFLDRNVLVIEQKPKFVELTNEYRILDETGNEIGVIRQEGQSKARKLLRLVSSIDQFLTHRLSMYDAGGAKVLDIVRPAKVLKSRLQVLDGAGTVRGWIVQENVVGKKHFGLQGAGGERLGSINAENWRSWDFAIEDPGGREVGRITKRWAGIIGEGFTTADRYLLHIATDVPTDLRLLMFASAAGIDTALKQDDTGGFGFGGIDLDI
ncbi:MAG TPA: phospholipid scramblase-related protein [Actinomycetota bacterium]|nr:phospholipid scramblase-related protein [Actinomycetota bacterium]